MLSVLTMHFPILQAPRWFMPWVPPGGSRGEGCRKGSRLGGRSFVDYSLLGILLFVGQFVWTFLLSLFVVLLLLVGQSCVHMLGQ